MGAAFSSEPVPYPARCRPFRCSCSADRRIGTDSVRGRLGHELPSIHFRPLSVSFRPSPVDDDAETLIMALAPPPWSSRLARHRCVARQLRPSASGVFLSCRTGWVQAAAQPGPHGRARPRTEILCMGCTLLARSQWPFSAEPQMAPLRRFPGFYHLKATSFPARHSWESGAWS